MQGLEPAPRLTIVLPLKGRHLFTLRFLWHANKARLPYRLLIADGQVDETVARHLENSREIFPNLDIEYVRYPNDANYSRFFAKMSDALSRVRTPYAMLADNDDFLGVPGIEQELDFLDANADYVCAFGRIAAFSVYAKFGNPDGAVHGRLNHLYMAAIPNDAAAPKASDRLSQGGIYRLIYHAVYRTEALATIWREAQEIDFSDPVLHENFQALRTLTLGKVHVNRTTITQFAQMLGAPNIPPSRDWVNHLLRSRFTSDIHAMIERLSAAAALADGVEAAPIAEQVRGMIESNLREFLSSNYGLRTVIKGFTGRKWSRFASYFQSRPQLFVGREKAALLSQLAGAGAAPEHLERTRAELAAIEAALSPNTFANFAASFRQTAPAAAQRDWSKTA